MTALEKIEPGQGILKIELEDKHVVKRAPIVEHERSLAVRELLRSNKFEPFDDVYGPYHIRLGIQDYRLQIQIRNNLKQDLEPVRLALKPFKRLIRDYFMICDSFMQAYRQGQQAHVETLDMTRRGIHNEGALLLKEYLKDKIEMDILTARGFFTLLCVLHV